jgi:hypothetical protein
VHMPMKDIGFTEVISQPELVGRVWGKPKRRVPTTKFDFANVDMTLQRKGRALSLVSLYKLNKTIHS